jgi:hypothetical protein
VRPNFSGPELADPNVSGASSDPDSDGISNEMEYLLNLDPKHADTKSNALPRAAIVDDHLTLTFSRYRPASDRALTIEWSPDLATWQTGQPYVEENLVTSDSVTDTVQIRDTRRVSQTHQGFLRFAVVAE